MLCFLFLLCMCKVFHMNLCVCVFLFLITIHSQTIQSANWIFFHIKIQDRTSIAVPCHNFPLTSGENINHVMRNESSALSDFSRFSGLYHVQCSSLLPGEVPSMKMSMIFVLIWGPSSSLYLVDFEVLFHHQLSESWYPHLALFHSHWTSLSTCSRASHCATSLAFFHCSPHSLLPEILDIPTYAFNFKPKSCSGLIFETDAF